MRAESEPEPAHHDGEMQIERVGEERLAQVARVDDVERAEELALTEGDDLAAKRELERSALQCDPRLLRKSLPLVNFARRLVVRSAVEQICRVVFTTAGERCAQRGFAIEG